MSRQTFYINNCWEAQDIINRLVDVINSVVERHNSDMEDTDLCEITVEFIKDGNL